MAQVLMMPIALPVFVSTEKKFEKFNGLNIKQWQQKMLFYYTTLNLVKILIENATKLKEDKRDIQVINAIDARKHSNILCRNYVMNELVDSLYNVYSYKKASKEL